MIKSISIRQGWEYEKPESQANRKQCTGVQLNIVTDTEHYSSHNIYASFEQMREVYETMKWFFEGYNGNDPERSLSKSLTQ